MKNGYRHSSSKKYAKMVLFGLKTHLKKIFLGYFYPPTLPVQKNWVRKVPKQVFTTQCRFQRSQLVGLKEIESQVKWKAVSAR